MDAINLVAPTSSRGELAPLFSTIAPYKSPLYVQSSEEE